MKLQLGWVLGIGIGLLCWGAKAAYAEHGRAGAPVEPRYLSQQCAPLLQHIKARRDLHLVKVLVLSQGMRLVIDGCPFVQVGEGSLQQVLDVRVRVTDSEIAARFVRGPLANDEEVDMGDVHLRTSDPSEPISPDVQFNRCWLADLMQRHGWQPLPGHWWAFVPTAI